MVELLTDHAEAGGGGSGDELLETANETGASTSPVPGRGPGGASSEVLDELRIGGGGGGGGGGNEAIPPPHRCSRKKKQRPLRTSRNGSLQQACAYPDHDAGARAGQLPRGCGSGGVRERQGGESTAARARGHAVHGSAWPSEGTSPRAAAAPSAGGGLRRRQRRGQVDAPANPAARRLDGPSPALKGPSCSTPRTRPSIRRCGTRPSASASSASSSSSSSGSSDDPMAASSTTRRAREPRRHARANRSDADGEEGDAVARDFATRPASRYLAAAATRRERAEAEVEAEAGRRDERHRHLSGAGRCGRPGAGDGRGGAAPARRADEPLTPRQCLARRTCRPEGLSPPMTVVVVSPTRPSWRPWSRTCCCWRTQAAAGGLPRLYAQWVRSQRSPPTCRASDAERRERAARGEKFSLSFRGPTA